MSRGGEQAALLLGEQPPPPMPRVVRSRLRWARLIVTVTQLPVPVLYVVLTFTNLAPRRDWSWSWVALPIVILVVCLLLWRARRYRPRLWPRNSAWMNGVAGFFLGVGLGPVSGSDLDDQGINWAVEYLMIAVGVPAAAWGSWWLGRVAQRIVLEPFIPELADSWLEIPFRSRVDRKQVLYIGYRRMVHPNGVASLDDVGPVKLITYDGDSIPSTKRQPALTPGPVVGFEVLGEVWVFPTDQGSEIAQVIDRRRPVPARRQPRRWTPGEQRFGGATARKINKLRRAVNERVAAAVAECAATPIAGSLTATAALRETCDMAINELIDASDTLGDAGRRMLRRDAAGIQGLRDRICGPVVSEPSSSTEEVGSIGER